MNEYEVGLFDALPRDGVVVHVYGAAVPEIVGENAIPKRIAASSTETSGNERLSSGSFAVSVAFVATMLLR